MAVFDIFGTSASWFYDKLIQLFQKTDENCKILDSNKSILSGSFNNSFFPCYSIIEAGNDSKYPGSKY